jgi:hypothetical protein
LVLAAKEGRTATVKALLDAGAGVHARQDRALVLAAKEGRTATVKALLDAGADVHARQNRALLAAEGGGHGDTVQALLAKSGWMGTLAAWIGIPYLIVSTRHFRFTRNIFMRNIVLFIVLVVLIILLQCWVLELCVPKEYVVGVRDSLARDE